MNHQVFITTLFPTRWGLAAGYVQHLPNGQGILITEVFYRPKTCEFVDLNLRMPEQMIDVTPEMLKEWEQQKKND